LSRFVRLIIVLFLLLNVAVLIFFLYPAPDALRALNASETVKIYDRHRELLFEVLRDDTGRQSFLPLSEIPDHLKNAFLSTEDQRFYEHSGVDLAATFRAIWQNVSAGEVVSGGSTITQQLVRNLVGVNRPRSFSQKAHESVLALKVSKFFDKDEVFETYLNSIYFGGLAYGVESASWQYFAKSASQLDLAESAFLAGLPQAPNRYYPFNHFERAKARQAEVLSAMLRTETITRTEFEQASEEIITLHYGSAGKEAPHFVDLVLSSGDPPADLHTTLDLGLQRRIETIVESDLTFLSHLNIQNAAVVVLDAKTGDVLAMMGSADYDDETIQGAVNVATALRQPGSSIKPLLYAAALEKGWTIDTLIVDEPSQFTTVDGLPYSPKNFDLDYRGEVTVAEALAQSLNVPAVKTLDYVGVSAFLSFAESLGITSWDQTPSHYGLSLALGSGEVSLLELANAYRALVNDGKYSPYRLIFSEEEVFYDQKLKPTTAHTISAILASNTLRLPAFGEENPLHFSFPAAAKTGTTRDFKDNWTLGYTDDFVVGVWVGNARGEVMQGVSGISGAGPIFNKIMSMIHEVTGTELSVDPSIELTIAQKNQSESSSDFDSFRILNPFANDVFLFDPSKPAEFQKVRFEASRSAEWFVDDRPIGEGSEVLWPLEKGAHVVRARFETEEREVMIQVR